MGVSILSGCLTTFGCGAFLFGGTFTFFYKFAFIICITVIISIMVAVFTFGAMCHTFGPQGGFCDIPCLKRKKKAADQEKEEV